MTEQGITRRQFLVGGGAAAALLAAGGIVGARSWRVKSMWWELTGAYGEPGAYPAKQDVTYRYATFRSAELGGDVPYGIAWPPGSKPGDRLPACYCLPGRGRLPREVLEASLRLGDFAAAPVVAGSVKPFALVAVRGGDTYWHERADGRDAMRMLREELIPLIEREYELGTARRMVMGWSMGGYGALRAAELDPQPDARAKGDERGFVAVCAASPALWQSFSDGVGDAFDDQRDYDENDVYWHADRLRGLPVRIDCGEEDPFYEATKAFVGALPAKPQGGFAPGGHNDAYWRKVAPAEMLFAGRALAGA